MPNPQTFEHSEPVPSVSQLCALPFVAGVTGYLVDTLGLPEVRATLHRNMTRDKTSYLQQLCAYGPAEAHLDHRTAGRIFTVTTGIIGEAYAKRRVVCTRRYASEGDWRADYQTDRERLGEVSTPEDGVRSYLAVPFLNPYKETLRLRALRGSRCTQRLRRGQRWPRRGHGHVLWLPALTGRPRGVTAAQGSQLPSASGRAIRGKTDGLPEPPGGATPPGTAPVRTSDLPQPGAVTVGRTASTPVSVRSWGRPPWCPM